MLLGFVLFLSAQLFVGSVTKGDVNGDEKTNVLDALCTVNIILGEPCPEPPPIEDQICAADVNGDGEVNVVDVILIVNEILYPDDDWFVSSCESCPVITVGPYAHRIVFTISIFSFGIC